MGHGGEFWQWKNDARNCSCGQENAHKHAYFPPHTHTHKKTALLSFWKTKLGGKSVFNWNTVAAKKIPKGLDDNAR